MGPKKSWDTPYATANEVMTEAAWPTVTSKLRAKSGSNVSVRRSEMPLANAAAAKAGTAALGIGNSSAVDGDRIIPPLWRPVSRVWVAQLAAGGSWAAPATPSTFSNTLMPVAPLGNVSSNKSWLFPKFSGPVNRTVFVPAIVIVRV
jgi:hypothetical protein